MAGNGEILQVSTVVAVSILDPPDKVNLEELVSLSRSALDILAPFCQTQTGDDGSDSSKIPTQALVYVGAIDSSINAARYGYGASEDVLKILKQIEQNANHEDVSAFLQNILLHAQNAHRTVDDTLDKFRSVRQKLFELVQVAKENRETGSHTESELKQLEECIHICKSLIDNVSMYAEWWNCIQLETRTQVGKAEQFQLNKNVSRMNRQASTKKWNEMKRKFSSYTVEITRLRNSHDAIFKLAATSPLTSSTHVNIEYLQEKLPQSAQPPSTQDTVESPSSLLSPSSPQSPLSPEGNIHSLSSQGKVEYLPTLEGENKEVEAPKKGWFRRIFGSLCCCCG